MQAEEWIGRTINSYVIERVIKSGGMGIILAAKHRFLDEKPVAIKIIHPDRQHDADMANRLLREANAAKSIRHPGVVEILDFGETPDGDVFLIMELCIGQDLGASLGKDGTFGEGKVARLGALIADALDATHRGGVIHRDLKPSNIMLLDGDENVKIVDFGIARFTAPGQTLTTAGAVMGTPDYMAPEQALGRAVDARTDIYAFGVILFELLTDRRPFVTDPGSELVSLLVKHITEPPPPPSQYVQVSPAMQALILQCLEKDPARRPQTMGEVADRLATLAQSVTPPVVRPPARRIGWYTAISAVGVAGFAIVLFLALRVTTGQIVLHTSPTEQVRIQLDGHALSAVDLDRMKIAAGPHTIVVEHDGYKPWSERVELKAGEVLSRSITLEQLPAAKVNPPSPQLPPAAVPAVAPPPKVVAASTPHERRPTRHRAELPTLAETTSAPMVEPPPVAKAPPPAAPSVPTGEGVFRVVSKPWTKIAVDGRDSGLTTPQTHLRLNSGPHRITLSNPQFGISDSFTVDIKTGETETVVKDLRRPITEPEE